MLLGACSAVFVLSIYVVLPWLRESGVLWFLVFNVCLVSPLTVMLMVALAVHRLEHPSWNGFAWRYRLTTASSDLRR